MESNADDGVFYRVIVDYDLRPYIWDTVILYINYVPIKIHQKKP